MSLIFIPIVFTLHLFASASESKSHNAMIARWLLCPNWARGVPGALAGMPSPMSFCVFTWSSCCGLPRLVEDSFGAYSILYRYTYIYIELSFTMVEIPIDQPISYGIIPINQAVFHGMMAFGRGSHCSPVFSSRHQWLQLGATAGCCTCPVSIQAGGCPAKSTANP